ncbi:MAG: hypothetical protein KGI75_14130 [Rhizobiaceae bacterium]|nr:hypothetical protein [Rhizobiaceae bacterium]
MPASIRRMFGEAVHHYDSTYYANFLPDEPVTVGDYGLLLDGAFKRLGSMSSRFGIEVEPTKPKSRSGINFNSGSGVSMQSNATATAHAPGLADGQATASISFAYANGLFFSAAGCEIVAIENEHMLHVQLLNLFSRGPWEAKMVAVTGIVTTKWLTLVTAAGNGAAIEISARAKGPMDFTELEVAAGPKIVAERSIGTKIISKAGTPLVRLAAVRMAGKWPLSRKTPIVKIDIDLIGEDQPLDLSAVRDQLLRSGGSIEEAFVFRTLEGEDEFT